MPVSYIPCCLPMFILVIILASGSISVRAGIVSGFIAICLICGFVLYIYIPGWRLNAKALHGDPISEYLYAQWLENHSWELQRLIPWPEQADVYGGFDWLQRAAVQDYPPAVWLVGVRVKYGLFTPYPADPEASSRDSPRRPPVGQRLIDHAENDLGFKPLVEPRQYYEQHYRMGLPP